jgi:hypothetical protein
MYLKYWDKGSDNFFCCCACPCYFFVLWDFVVYGYAYCPPVMADLTVAEPAEASAIPAASAGVLL